MSLGRLDPTLGDDAALPVGHDSRREESDEQVRTLTAKLRSQLSVLAGAAYIELAKSSIDDAIETMTPTHRTMTVASLSLLAASHVKNGVSLAVQRAHTTHGDAGFRFGSHLGTHPSLMDLLNERMRAAGSDLGVDCEDDDVAVVLCARGPSDPDSNGNVYKLVCLLYEDRGSTHVKSALTGVTMPQLEETFHTATKDRSDAVVAPPYMFGDGVLTERIVDTAETFDKEYPYIDAGASGPLDTDARVVKTLIDRYQETRSGNVEMSCDTCKYKIELAGYEDDEGGAHTMLCSFVHQAEHAGRSDVGDDPHVHDAPGKHVVTCTNQTCAAGSAAIVLEQLRQGTRDADDCDTRVSRSSCLGQCGNDPVVTIYPDSVWYDGVTPDDTDRIVSSCPERDRIVSNPVYRSL